MSNPGVHDIKFDSASDQPVRMEVFIGQAQVGAYTVTEHDEIGAHLNDLRSGNNVDSLPDIFDLPIQAQSDDGKHIGWNIVIAAPDDSPGQLFFARVSFTQNGKNLSGSPIERSGALEGEKILLGFARFAAA